MLIRWSEAIAGGSFRVIKFVVIDEYINLEESISKKLHTQNSKFRCKMFDRYTSSSNPN